MKTVSFVLMLVTIIAGTALAQDPTPTGEPVDPRAVFLRQWASDAKASSEYGEDDYSAKQATGAPDTVGCSDARTAWASETTTGEETLELFYETPVIPLRVEIYQNVGNGAIVSVELIPAEGGDPIILPDSADPRTDCPGVFRLPVVLETPVFVTGVVIHFDQSITNYWNEIDAVRLTGLTEAIEDEFILQWASAASATSQFTDEAWNAMQSTGEPNSFGCGDFGTAWASATGTGVDDLTVNFAEAVRPIHLNIYQTYNPGAITSVDLLPASGGAPIPVPNSADPGTACPGIFTLDLTRVDDLPPINGAVIHLDQTLTGGWNEIDAVELVGVKPSA